MMSVSRDHLQMTILLLQQFIQKYEKVGDAHMVDYFTKDHWSTLLSDSVRKQVTELGVDELCQRFAHGGNGIKLITDSTSSANPNAIEDLDQYTEEASSCHLSKLSVLTPIESIQDILLKPTKRTSDADLAQISSKEYMCNKKSHEVDLMSPIVHALCLYASTSQVLDVGSGKGYLSTHLSLRYNLDVTAVDNDQSNTSGASTRAAKYLNYWKKHLNGKRSCANSEVLISKNNLTVTPVTAHVNCETDLVGLKSDSIDDSPDNSDMYVMTGLHTCGNLCSDLLSLFVKSSKVDGMCVVGCCYHLLTESLAKEAGFPMSNFTKMQNIMLGRNKRMLALKAPERFACASGEEKGKSDRSLFYRAVLSVILKEKFKVSSDCKDVQVGKVFSKSCGFVDYVRKSLKKLKLNDEVISAQEIENYLKLYTPHFNELIAFSFLRQMFAPAVESMILLDKLLFLMESAETAGIQHIYLTKLFDPVLSPRCYAFVAFKNKH